MKTAFGWLVLIGALAIPAVLFWKWWIAMQTTTTFEVKQKPPQEQAAFGEVKSAQANPIETAEVVAQAAPSEASPAGNGDAALDEAPDTTARVPAQDPAPAAGETEAGEPPQGGPAEDTEQTPPLVPGAVGTGGGSGRVRYAPKSSRDPMVSIFDLRELAKRRLAKELARRQVKKALEKPPPTPVVKVRRPPPPPPKPYCDQVELQGIIATPNGIAAIIDDEVRSEGDIVKGAVVARITTRTVIFKKRRRTVCVKRVDR